MIPEISLNPGRNFRDNLHYINKKVGILKTPAYEKQGRLSTDIHVMLKCLAKREKFNGKEPDIFVHTMPNSWFGWVFFCFYIMNQIALVIHTQ